MPTPRAWNPVVTCFASSPTLQPPARRKCFRSISAPEELDQRRDARSGLVVPPGRSPPKPAFDLNRQNPGNSPESHQLVGLHRTRQYADPRERRAVAKAKRATGSGDLIDATSCVVRDRDINSAHCVALALGFGP